MLSQTIGYVGGLYIARGYLQDRLEEVRERLEVERVARENLRRRFQQTQEDASYTVLALLPTLSEQILQTMDIESLTTELQARSKARNLSSSVQLSDSYISAAGSVSQSWVEASSPTPSASATSSIAESSDDNGRSEAGPVEPLSASDPRSKTQLWNEVKILTFTRTLTTLYSTTLLCLLTTLQLTFLARSKYVASVLEQERQERVREQLEAGLTTSNLVFGSFGLGPTAGSHLETLLSGGSVDEDDLDNQTVIRGPLWSPEGVGEEVESKYLTLSWWLLHVGWKDVGERVRRAVEETLDGVSLKSKLAAIDLHRLISDIRRRVEHEITFEGKERRTNFLSSLLPPTLETIHHVLTQGGYKSSTYPSRPHVFGAGAGNKPTESSGSPTSSQLSHSFVNSPALAISTAHPHRTEPVPTFITATPPPHAHVLDEPFASLLSESREVISSKNFSKVLEACLDHATDVLFDSLEKNVFISSGDGDTEEVRIKLAALLPGLARWSQLALDGLPNELVDKTLTLREVSCLSAIGFGRFEEQFI